MELASRSQKYFMQNVEQAGTKVTLNKFLSDDVKNTAGQVLTYNSMNFH